MSPGLPLVRVVVAVEDGALVLDEDVLEHLVDSSIKLHGRKTGFDLAREVSQGISEDRVENNVGASDGLGGTDGSELELVLSEGERRGSVSIGASSLDVRKGDDTHVDLHGGRGLTDGLLEVLVDGGADVGAEEDGHDGGRSLVGAKSEVVGGTSDAGSQEVAVHVDGANGSGNHQEEGDVLLRLISRSEQAGDLPIDRASRGIPRRNRWRSCCACRNR